MNHNDQQNHNGLNMREFLKAVAGSSILALGWNVKLSAMTALEGIENPLAHYPERGWEKTYRDQYAYDRSFTWICAPNDTHMCRFRAFVRNGVMVRTEQNYDHDRYGDMYGNKMTKAWNPRGCLNRYFPFGSAGGVTDGQGPVYHVNGVAHSKSLARIGLEHGPQAGRPSLLGLQSELFAS